MNLRGQLHPSYESELVIDKKGLWTGSQIYHCHADDLATVAPLIGSAHPRYGWLYLESFAISGQEGDIVKITGQYVGVNANYDFGENSDNYESGLRLSTADSPLGLNAYYDTLTAAEINEAVQLGMNPQKNTEGTLKTVDTSVGPR